MNEFHYEKVKDPTYFSENRVAAHSDHRYFTSLAAMEQEKEELRYSLNGLWKFHYAKNYRVRFLVWRRKTTAVKSGRGDDRVPAHIQMEGYDKPQYANVQYPWEGREEGKPGEIPESSIRWQAM